MFAPKNSETPCPDNAHGTALADQETQRLPALDGAGNPVTSTAPTWKPGAPSLLGSVASSNELAPHAAPPGVRELNVRELVCRSLLDMQGLALAQDRADHAVDVARGALAFLRAYDRKLPTHNGSEDELCELGAAVELLLNEWDAHDSSRDCEDVAAAVQLVRDRWHASFLPLEVCEALKSRNPGGAS